MKSRFFRNGIYFRNGRSCQEYRVRGWEGNSGIGTILPKGLLKEGQRYRFEVWCQGQENPDASGCLRSFFASVYSGTPRPNWDCYTGCISAVETATRGHYSPLHVDFTARKANHLHVVFQGIKPYREGEMALLVDSVTVSPILSETTRPKGIPHSLDVELMVLGEALATAVR